MPGVCEPADTSCGGANRKFVDLLSSELLATQMAAAAHHERAVSLVQKWIELERVGYKTYMEGVVDRQSQRFSGMMKSVENGHTDAADEGVKGSKPEHAAAASGFVKGQAAIAPDVEDVPVVPPPLPPPPKPPPVKPCELPLDLSPELCAVEEEEFVPEPKLGHPASRKRPSEVLGAPRVCDIPSTALGSNLDLSFTPFGSAKKVSHAVVGPCKGVPQPDEYSYAFEPPYAPELSLLDVSTPSPLSPRSGPLTLDNIDSGVQGGEDDTDRYSMSKIRVSCGAGDHFGGQRSITSNSSDFQRRGRPRKCSIITSPRAPQGKDFSQRSCFVDEEVMKEKVRQAIHKPVYNVHNSYRKTGIWQHIARSVLFEHLTLSVIALNALWIAVDTDYNHADTILDAHWCFQLGENLFCAYFTLEWLVRFMAFKVKHDCLKDYWFIFDTGLVSLMVLETWFMTGLLLLSSTGSSGSGVGSTSVLRLVRLLRLSRMARMARLLRVIPELVVLVKGMLVSTRSVATTLFLLVIFLYVFGIAFTQLCRKTQVGEERFPSVLSSMYSLLLYGVLCLDYVEDVATGLAQLHPAVPALYFLFVLLAAFTVMNMLIGVLCEVVSQVAAIEKEQSVLTYAKERLYNILKRLDEDGNMLISRREFTQLIDNPEACVALHELGVDVVGLIDFADVIFEVDTGDEDVQLTFEEFIEIVLQLRGSSHATVRDCVELRKMCLQLSTETKEILTHLNRRPSRLSE